MLASRPQILIGWLDGRTRVVGAATLKGKDRRQVCRPLDAFRTHGADAPVTKRRTRPSNRAHGVVFRRSRLAIVRERYEDFGPTHAAQKLAEVQGLPIGVGALRQWLIEDGIWVRGRDRIKRAPSSARQSRFAGLGRWPRARQCLADFSKETLRDLYLEFSVHGGQSADAGQFPIPVPRDGKAGIVRCHHLRRSGSLNCYVDLTDLLPNRRQVPLNQAVVVRHGGARFARRRGAWCPRGVASASWMRWVVKSKSQVSMASRHPGGLCLGGQNQLPLIEPSTIRAARRYPDPAGLRSSLPLPSLIGPTRAVRRRFAMVCGC